MFDMFGEFDSAEEINLAAAELKAKGDEKKLVALALENGIDKEDAADYMNDEMDTLVTLLSAAEAKIKVEAERLEVGGILIDWKNTILDACLSDEKMQRAVRKKGKSLCGCLAMLMKFAFENKVQVSNEIVKKCRVKHNGKEEPLRGPLYLGIPSAAQSKKIVTEYYLGVNKK